MRPEIRDRLITFVVVAMVTSVFLNCSCREDKQRRERIARIEKRKQWVKTVFSLKHDLPEGEYYASRGHKMPVALDDIVWNGSYGQLLTAFSGTATSEVREGVFDKSFFMDEMLLASYDPVRFEVHCGPAIQYPESNISFHCSIYGDLDGKRAVRIDMLFPDNALTKITVKHISFEQHEVPMAEQLLDAAIGD